MLPEAWLLFTQTLPEITGSTAVEPFTVKQLSEHVKNLNLLLLVSHILLKCPSACFKQNLPHSS